MNENLMEMDLMNNNDMMATDLSVNNDVTDLGMVDVKPVWHFDPRSAVIGGLTTLAVVTALGVVRQRKLAKKQATIEEMAKQKVAAAHQAQAADQADGDFAEVETETEKDK